jgi:putative PIN family toxin of toxin-antitoxin system
MIRVVLDTNIVISGTLWSGSPKQVMQIVEAGKALPLVTEAMLDELKEVIERPKFAKRLELLGKTAQEIISQYASKAEIIEAVALDESVSSDPDDDIFLACAISGKAQMIVSGDPHLLNVKQYQNIPILTAGDFLLAVEKDGEED